MPKKAYPLTATGLVRLPSLDKVLYFVFAAGVLADEYTVPVLQSPRMCVSVCGTAKLLLVGSIMTERKRQRKRETERKRPKERDRERETERKRQRKKQRNSQRERQREPERKRERERAVSFLIAHLRQRPRLLSGSNEACWCQTIREEKIQHPLLFLKKQF